MKNFRLCFLELALDLSLWKTNGSPVNPPFLHGDEVGCSRRQDPGVHCEGVGRVIIPGRTQVTSGQGLHTMYGGLTWAERTPPRTWARRHWARRRLWRCQWRCSGLSSSAPSPRRSSLWKIVLPFINLNRSHLECRKKGRGGIVFDLIIAVCSFNITANSK